MGLFAHFNRVIPGWAHRSIQGWAACRASEDVGHELRLADDLQLLAGRSEGFGLLQLGALGGTGGKAGEVLVAGDEEVGLLGRAAGDGAAMVDHSLLGLATGNGEGAGEGDRLAKERVYRVEGGVRCQFEREWRLVEPRRRSGRLASKRRPDHGPDCQSRTVL
jgi:hypothetical protein